MKVLKEYIVEKLKIDDDIKVKERTKPVYFPKTKKELIQNIKEVLDSEGFDANLNVIDTSEITDMSDLFRDFPDIENIDISEWNVSKVTKMNMTFYKCTKFNSDISLWDVSSLTEAFATFSHCENFDADLSSWDVTNLKNAKSMFYGCKKFNSNLANWNVENLEECQYMFSGCEKFKSNLEIWKPEKIMSSGRCEFMFRHSGVKRFPTWYRKLFKK